MQSRALSLTRTVLRALIIVNPIVGVLILVLLGMSYLYEDFVFGAFTHLPPEVDMVGGMRIVMVVGIVAVPFNHVILTRLLAMVHAVREGDPFVSENAVRLRSIAWALLALQILNAIASSMGGIGVDASLAGWLAVLLVFVLARVFEHGARMRDDLAGTV